MTRLSCRKLDLAKARSRERLQQAAFLERPPLPRHCREGIGFAVFRVQGSRQQRHAAKVERQRDQLATDHMALQRRELGLVEGPVSSPLPLLRLVMIMMMRLSEWFHGHGATRRVRVPPGSVHSSTTAAAGLLDWTIHGPTLSCSSW